MITVLIMEDQVELASHWREALEATGYAVVHVTDYEKALLLLKSHDFQVVVCDMLIRDEDDKPSRTGGLTLLTHLRLHVKPSPKIVAVSGAAPDLNVLQHAELLNADTTIVKPFTAQELVDTIKGLLAVD